MHIEDCWPTEEHELLLKACLLPGQEAIGAWERWVARVNVDHLDAGSDRLLPLLYSNLLALGVDHELMPRLKGIYRYHWCRNQALLGDAAKLVRELATEGVDTIILKGAPLVLLYYGSSGTRPMYDVDILVPVAQARAAIAHLQARGWVPKAPLPAEPTARDLYTVKAQEFRKPGVGTPVDLHWHLLEQSREDESDATFWGNSVPVTLQGVPTRALCAADELLHVCVHGIRWCRVPSMRWVVDAAAILRTAGPSLAWDRLVELARMRHLALPLAPALEYLARVYALPIPAEALRALRGIRITRLDRLAYEEQISPPAPRGAWHGLQMHFLRHRRRQPASTPMGRLLTFPRYLMAEWRLNRWYELPVYVAGNTTRRLLSQRLTP